MLKKTISYVDYDGVERREDFYFNLSKAELTDMELEVTGGIQRKIERIVNEQDIPKIVGILKEIILASYGKKSDDGKRFIKKENGRVLSEEFVQTEAYVELYVELINDPDKFAAFINGIIPQSFAEELAKNPQIMSALPSTGN